MTMSSEEASVSDEASKSISDLESVEAVDLPGILWCMASSDLVGLVA